MSGADALGPEVGSWLALGAGLAERTIRLVLADIDGVVTPGEGLPARLSVLERLAAINAAARVDPCVPAISLCTGRQAPYVELMAQLTSAFLPCIFEHGAGLFLPRAFRYLYHPCLGPGYAASLARVRAALDERLLRSGRAFLQPGKEATMTLYPLGETSLDALARTAQQTLAEQQLPFTIEQNLTGVEVRPPGIDKGEGCRWLIDVLGLRIGQLCGVGDTDPDLVFLTLPSIGWAAAPANATPGVRAAVGYVALADDGDGLLEIIAEVERRNRGLNRAAAAADTR